MIVNNIFFIWWKWFLNELYNRNIISFQVNLEAEILIRKWKNENIPHKNFHQAYAVYLSSISNRFPLTLKEISYHFGISIKNICKVEKYVKTKIQRSPFDFLEKFCKILNLSFIDEKIIEKKNSDFDWSDSRPSLARNSPGDNFVVSKIDQRLLSDATALPLSTIRKISNKCARIRKNRIKHRKFILNYQFSKNT